jgi:alkylation response protein AidB-like acyl-CoA dehydrogenase
MNFDLTEPQKLLLDTVSAFVKKQSPTTRMRAMRDDPVGWSKSVWQKLGEFGWLGVLFDEALGGYGGSFVDAAIVLEEFGSTLVPEPLAATLVAGTAIARGGSDVLKRRWLAPTIEGKLSLAFAHDEPDSRYAARQVASRATRSGNGYQLTGHKRFVVNGHAADAVVVSARTAGDRGDADGISLFLVARDAPGLRVQPVKTMDGHHAALLTFEQAFVPAEQRLGAEGAALPILEEVLDVGAAACLAEGVGIMRSALAMTTDYLRTRDQFGVKIGTFQALQHRAVDMFVETELARSASIMAALRLDDPDPLVRQSAISAAKVQLAVSGRFVTQQAIQLHGGIGITDEHDIGLYFKRMHVLNTLYGDEEYHLARFARLPNFVDGVRT